MSMYRAFLIQTGTKNLSDSAEQFLLYLWVIAGPFIVCGKKEFLWTVKLTKKQ